MGLPIPTAWPVRVNDPKVVAPLMGATALIALFAREQGRTPLPLIPQWPRLINYKGGAMGLSCTQRTYLQEVLPRIS